MADDKAPEECPECGSNNILYNESREQIVCRDCGSIYEPTNIKDIDEGNDPDEKIIGPEE